MSTEVAVVDSGSTPSANEGASSTELATQSQSVSTDTSGSGGDAGGSLPVSYTPNFKFKVLDKEHEIPEFLRTAVKDQTTEKQLRELHEKAYGLDVVKPKYQETRKELETIKKQFSDQNQSLAQLGKYIQNNDLDSFFKALRISEEQVLRYALDRVRYRELPLEQRMAVDAQAQERQRLYTLEQQSAEYQQNYQAQATQARELQLSMALGQPHVKSVADALDAKVGRPGAFRDEVIKRGQLAYYTTGADISVEQAMNEVMALAAGIVQPGGTPAAIPGAVSGTGGAQAPAKPPVIPNVAGSGSSPVKKAVRSISDIRQRAAEL